MPRIDFQNYKHAYNKYKMLGFVFEAVFLLDTNEKSHIWKSFESHFLMTIFFFKKEPNYIRIGKKGGTEVKCSVVSWYKLKNTEKIFLVKDLEKKGKAALVICLDFIKVRAR